MTAAVEDNYNFMNEVKLDDQVLARPPPGYGISGLKS